MKTEPLKEFYQTLSELNNSFTHYTFVWNQFNIDYLEILESQPETLTKDYFQNNPYKRKHNVKFKVFENEHRKTDTTLINGIFVLLFSNFEEFLKSQLQFAQLVNSNIKSYDEKSSDFEDDSIVYDKVLNRIDVSKENFPEEINDTLDYLRLKRNKLVHSNSKNISGTSSNLIKSKGEKLNAFWNSKLPSDLQGMDFNNKENFNILNFTIIIDTINILRGIASEINNAFVSKLSIENIVENFIISEFQKMHQGKINGYKSERKISKFKRYCKTEFSLNLNENLIEIYKRSIV